jgi:hypothetical protein
VAAPSRFQAVSEAELDQLQITDDPAATPQRRKDARDRMKLPENQGTALGAGGRVFLYVVHPRYTGFAEEASP